MNHYSEIAIINGCAYHLGLTPAQLTPNLILVGDPARAYKVAGHFDTIKNEVTNREYITLTGTYRQMPCSVIGTGIGTDNVEIAIIESYGLLAMDLASRRLKDSIPNINLIRVGTSGGVQPDLEPGIISVAKYALGLDSTGLYYDVPAADETVTLIEKQGKQLLDQAMSNNSRFKNQIFPYASKASPEVARLLTKYAEELDVPMVSGITASTPGFYGPSGRFIDGLVNSVPNIKDHLADFVLDGLKIVNMEMESSLIFHLCFSLGINAGTICPIISNPNKSTSLVDYQKYIDLAIKIALNSMRELTGKATP